MMSWFLMAQGKPDCGKELPAGNQPRDLYSHQQSERERQTVLHRQKLQKNQRKTSNMFGANTAKYSYIIDMTEIIVQARSITRYRKERHESGRKHPLEAMKHAGTSANKFPEPGIAGRWRFLTGKEPLSACSIFCIITNYPLPSTAGNRVQQTCNSNPNRPL